MKRRTNAAAIHFRAAVGATVIASSLGLATLAGCARSEGSYTGYVEADYVYVSAPITGVVQSLSVARGARVAAGAELFRLDTDVESLARLEAAAREAQARAQATDLRKGRRPAEIAAIEQQLAQARANLAASRAQLLRVRDLVRQGFESPSRLDDLQAAEARDDARVKELDAQLTVARTAARPDEIAAADAQTRAADAARAQQAWREGQKRQLAPVAGQVFDVMYRVGERVPANAPVVALLPDSALKVRFYVPQDALARVQVGTSVQVSCDGCAAGLAAQVSFVSPQAEYTPPVIYSNESRHKLVFLVEARPDAATMAQLKPGQPLDVRLART